MDGSHRWRKRNLLPEFILCDWGNTGKEEGVVGWVGDVGKDYVGDVGVG